MLERDQASAMEPFRRGRLLCNRNPTRELLRNGIRLRGPSTFGREHRGQCVQVIRRPPFVIHNLRIGRPTSPLSAADQMTLLAELVAASSEVASTSSRSRKVAILAE